MRLSNLTLLLSALTFAGCATPSQMTTGPSVLGADGQVKVTDGPNGNTVVKIKIQHLAPASKVVAGATVYVAWIQATEGGTQQNIGQIQLNADEEGTLETVTPFKGFTVTVTAEPTATATTPGSNPVLITKIVSKT
jgi:hypothetical protein